MTDSTRVILPAAQAFSSGVLEMPERLVSGAETAVPAWSEYPLNTCLLILATLLILVSLKIFLNIAPYLWRCLSRWKPCLNIDASVQLKGDRNTLGIIFILPIALVADRFAFFNPGFIKDIPASWHCLLTLGTVAAWLFLRHFCFYLCSIKVKRQELFRTAHMSFYNYWTVLGILMVLTAGLLVLAGVPDTVTRQVLIYESSLIYFVAIVRKCQILRSFCGPFSVFLYLCALEIIPTGALIAAMLLP